MSAIAMFTARRLVGLVLTLLVASFLIYAALAIAPGNPATLIAGGSIPSPHTVAVIEAQFHLKDPLMQRYWLWLSGILRGHLGESFVYRASVGSLIASRVVNTIFLVVYSALLILLFGIGLGVIAALAGGRTSTTITTLTTIAMGAPTFVVAIFLIWLFATKLDWFPVFGAGTGFTGRLAHLTLPAVALALTYIAYAAQVTRTSVNAELGSEHVDTARSRGLPFWTIVRRHVLLNASAPILAVSGLTIAGLIAGTAVAEDAFGVNGIGDLLIQSASKQDLPTVQAISLLMVAAFVVINTLVDVINVVLDPRLASRR